jgi:hypothetical protein
MKRLFPAKCPDISSYRQSRHLIASSQSSLWKVAQQSPEVEDFVDTKRVEVSPSLVSEQVTTAYVKSHEQQNKFNPGVLSQLLEQFDVVQDQYEGTTKTVHESDSSSESLLPSLYEDILNSILEENTISKLSSFVSIFRQRLKQQTGSPTSEAVAMQKFILSFLDVVEEKFGDDISPSVISSSVISSSVISSSPLQSGMPSFSSTVDSDVEVISLVSPLLEKSCIFEGRKTVESDNMQYPEPPSLNTFPDFYFEENKISNPIVSTQLYPNHSQSTDTLIRSPNVTPRSCLEMFSDDGVITAVQLQKFLESEVDLYQLILCYTPISLEEVLLRLRRHGCCIKEKELLPLLDSLAVFVNRSNNQKV